MLNAQNLELTFNPGTPIETRALRGLSLSIPTASSSPSSAPTAPASPPFCVSGDQSVDKGRSKLPAST
jgi:putative ABC transport system ATP-binding protein